MLTRLTQREKQAIDFITACGYRINAFSVSFDVSRGHVKALLYYNREEMLHGASEENFYEPAAAPRPAAHAHTHATPAPPSAPPSAVPPARSFAQKHEHKQAQKQAARVDAKPKPKERTRVDRNSLSACGSSVTFSDAAIAAQARADAAKDRNEPAKKRPRGANAQPAHVPSPPAHEPEPRGRISVRAPDVSEEDAQQLETVAARNGVPVPTTSEQAEIFMQSIMGIRLWESDGSGRGETEGEVVGYNTLNGDNYGGSDGPLPPGARAAFVLAKSGWQAAPASKGKRGRS